MFSYFKDKLKKAVSSAEEEIEDEVEEKQVKKDHKEVQDKPSKTVKEETTEKEDEEGEDENEGFFSKVKETLITKELTEEKFETVFWDIELILLENNVAQDVVDSLKQKMRERLIGTRIYRGKLEETLRETLEETLQESLQQTQRIDIIEEAKKSDKPYKIVVIGINGSGKTTTIAKLANMYKKEGMNPILGAADTFRAAAIDQLDQHAQNLNVPCIKQGYGSDPAAVAYDAVQHAKKNRGVALIDTAGRLHSNTNLMNQLKKIVDVTSPHRVIYVAESVAGNDVIKQATTFSEHVNVDGIIMTKADTDEKGGTILSASYITQKPVLYIGTGQQYDDLESFDLDSILSNLFS